MTDEITLCLQQIDEGVPGALDRLLPHIYADLRGLAAVLFKDQTVQHTLQPTALVHEAYIRLAKPGNEFKNRKHFLRVAAMAMRQLLTDYARARSTDKRGGGVERILLSEDVAEHEASEGAHVEELDVALRKLEALSERQAQIVELRFLVGLSIEETANVLDVSPATVSLDWKMARIFLQRELKAS